MTRDARLSATGEKFHLPSEPLPGKSAPAASVHGTVALPGCMIHSDISVSALEWICRVLRCEEGPDQPAREAFDGFHATLRVQTFDDIDICVKIAVAALALCPLATIGLRELVVNAVEHGNLGITFDEKTDLLTSGDWQAEIERRLAATGMRDRFATVELRLNDTSFRIDITDQGKGFDWRTYLDPQTSPSATLHGRGLPLAMEAGYSSVEYRGNGNHVVLTGECGTAADA